MTTIIRAFLFTDVVGSTGHWERQPEAMQAALVRHDELCAQAIAHSGGDLFKHTGDGVVAAFTDAGSAATAAVELQRLLAAEPWPTPQPILVRMGIHVGDAEQRGDDYFGADVGRAARVMDAGNGRQVLISATASTGVREAGFDLADLGIHRFRGVAEPMRVWHLVHDDLPPPDELPPIRTAMATVDTLPARRALVAERERIVEQAVAAAAPRRVVTLVGPAGIGKSRVAIEAAHRLKPEHADGVAFVDLGRGTLITQCVGALGLDIAPDDREGLIETLAGRRLLLVLDHADRSLDEVREFAVLVSTECINVAIMVTAHRSVGVADETTVIVPSLTAGGPEVFAATTGHGLVDEPDVDAVEQLCLELDGNPRAIEIVATRSATLGARHALDHLPALVDESASDESESDRHHSLAALMDWTYDLLDDDQRTVVDTAAAFANWFDDTDLDSLATSGPVALSTNLDRLAELSLIRTDRTSNPNRFRLGNSLRQHRRRRLQAERRLSRLLDAHADHVTRRIETIGASLRGRDERRARSDFDRLRDEVGPAVRHLCSAGDLDGATAIVTSLAPFDAICWPDIAELADLIVRSHGEATAPAARSSLDALVLAQAGSAASRSGDTRRAETLARAAVDRLEDHHGPYAWSVLANALATGGDHLGAAEAIGRGVAAAEAGGDAFDLATSLSGQSIFLFWAGDSAPAVAAGARAIDAAQQSGSETALASAAGAYGTATIRADPELASELLDLAVELSADIGNIAHELIARRGRGLLLRTQRDFPAAGRALIEAMRLADQTASELEYRLCAGLMMNVTSRAGLHDITLAVERSMNSDGVLASDGPAEAASDLARAEIGVVGSSRILLEAGRRNRRDLLAWLSGQWEDQTAVAA